MIQLTIENINYDIASSYEDLSLGQYIDILKLSDSRVKLDGNEADIKIISILSDKPAELEKALWNFSIDEFKELTEHFTWVQDVSVIEEFKKTKAADTLMVDGKPYSIISNYNKMSLGEVISFETILKQENSDFHRMDIAFGCLMRPIVDGHIAKFSEETFLEVIKNKYHVKMVDIYGVLSFFLSGETKSTTKSTKAFSIQKK